MVPRLDAKLFDDIRRRFSALEVRTLRMVPIFDVGPVVYPTATAPSQLALQVQIVIGQEMLSPLTQDSLQRGGSLIGGNVLNAENRPLSLSSIQRWLGWDLIFARAVTLDKTAFFWRWVSDQAPRRAFHLISLSEPRARQKATAYAARRLLEWSFVLQPVLGSNGRHVPPPTALVDLAMACQSPDEFERVWAESDQLEGIVDACLSENRALWACIRSIGRRHYSR
ncbi:MAG: hypothetical protein J0I47_09200 [Sphingomonas sp.]|uniref:hypothetical protein n=1 Tax=Sphingomonas sp. TaxID=28214 RepID=UPI001AC8071F|nr:hypothetical protein [Sphingomonas sp.]MBN8808395.1 hypothetical protein [Sphingomonas sp.]